MPSASRGTWRCSVGCQAGERPTAPGARIGTARSRRAPASARPRPSPKSYPKTRNASPTAAGPITSGWRRTASTAEAPDAFLGPFLIDVDVPIGPLLAGPALDILDSGAGYRRDMEAISGFGGSGWGRGRFVRLDTCRRRRGDDRAQRDDQCFECHIVSP